MSSESPMHILKTTIDHIAEVSERLRAADHVSTADDRLQAFVPDFRLAADAADILDALAAHLSEAKGMLQ